MSRGSWEWTLESLLGGLNHALSNRLSTIATVAQYLQSGDADPAEIGVMLDEEAEKLERLLSLLRLLPRSPSTEPVPFDVDACMSDAVALLRHHADFHTVPPVALGAAGLAPVLCDEAWVLRLVLVICVAIADGGRNPVTIRVAEEEQRLQVRITTERAPASADDAAVWARVTELAARAGLALRLVRASEAGAWTAAELRLPSLVAPRPAASTG